MNGSRRNFQRKLPVCEVLRVKALQVFLQRLGKALLAD